MAGIANALYLRLVEQSRTPRFYIDLHVPDTVDGRFDMIVLHVMLVTRRLRGQNEEAAVVSQEVLNLLFADMDRNFREMGIGDMSIGKHVKKVAKAFYGRAEILENGLEAGPGELADALGETIYRAVEDAKAHTEAMATYIAETDAFLAEQQLSDLLEGQLDFAIQNNTAAQAV